MLSARGRHELHARVLNHWFAREAPRPFIVQMLATCLHNLRVKTRLLHQAREQSVEDLHAHTLRFKVVHSTIYIIKFICSH